MPLSARRAQTVAESLVYKRTSKPGAVLPAPGLVGGVGGAKSPCAGSQHLRLVTKGPPLIVCGCSAEMKITFPF